MKNLTILFLSFVFCWNLSASDEATLLSLFPEGEHGLKAQESHEACPAGQITHLKKEVAGEKLSLIMLDTQISFDVAKAESKITEHVPESCHYEVEVKLHSKGVVRTTSKSACPDPKENGVLVEKLQSSKAGFSYHSAFQKMKSVDCFYEFSTAKVEAK